MHEQIKTKHGEQVASVSSSCGAVVIHFGRVGAVFTVGEAEQIAAALTKAAQNARAHNAAVADLVRT